MGIQHAGFAAGRVVSWTIWSQLLCLGAPSTFCKLADTPRTAKHSMGPGPSAKGGFAEDEGGVPFGEAPL